MAERCAENNYEKIKEEIANIKCDEGGINSGHLWKLNKKLSPRCRDPPTAMLDLQGNLVTSEDAIESLAVDTYRNRLKNREMKEDLKHIQVEKEYLCKMRLKLARNKKTPPWNMDDLSRILKHLKKNKSRDPMGYSNEIFGIDVAGDDLKVAILKLMNKIKDDQIFPTTLEDCDISSIFKNKGSRNDFSSYRGIFRVPILRCILDRLIYNDEYDVIDANLTDSNVGARKKRNIRDNIFVLNAINNSVVNGSEEPVDLQIFDVEKCFDALWVEECINDMFEAGFDNDKLPLIYIANQNARIAVKSSTGKSQRVNISNVVMQGTVWGSMLCTGTMDKLGQLVYNGDKTTYKYKGVVDTPCLGMVDDILSVQKCKADTIKSNATMNAFIESKKLTLSKSKSHRIHISSKKQKKMKDCVDLKIHDEKMDDSDKEKYLGDFIDNTGTITSTIEDRKNKGYAMAAEIISILDEIPLGQHRMEIGLLLRQAMLINAMLFNSEAWHSIKDKDIKMLEAVDEYLLRSLVHAHAKSPLEFLYLESGAVPIRFLISSRRMTYLQTILQRNDNELTKRIYSEQKRNPTPGDFSELVKKDFEVIDEKMDESNIIGCSIEAFKSRIKQKIRIAAFKFLRSRQQTHSKVRDVQFSKLETQKYLISPLFTNEEVNTLYSLRSRSVECKNNFKNRYKEGDELCPLCDKHIDDQKNMLQCPVIIEEVKTNEVAKEEIKYEYIFENPEKQKAIASLFVKYIGIRKKIMEEDLLQRQDPSTCTDVLKTSDPLPCIDNLSFGK